MRTHDSSAAVRAYNTRVTALSLSAWLTTVGFVLGIALDFNNPMSVAGVGAFVALAAGVNVGTFVATLIRKGRAARRSTEEGATR